MEDAMENKGIKREMTLQEAQTILSKLVYEGAFEEWGDDMGWWLNGVHVADGLFYGNTYRVTIKESRQFKETTFHGDDALSLRYLGTEVHNGAWLKKAA